MAMLTSTSFTSPTTGLTIARLQNGSEILARYLAHELPMVMAVCPPDHAEPRGEQDEQDLSFHRKLGATDLNEVLERICGVARGCWGWTRRGL